MKVTRTIAVVVSVSSLLLASCRSAGRDSVGAVEESARQAPVATQQQPPPAVQQPLASQPQTNPEPAPQPPRPQTAPTSIVSGGQNAAIPPQPDTVRGPRPVGTSGRVETLPDGRPTDQVLLDRVEALLATDARLRDVNVTVDEGIILLKGSVTDPGARDRAFALAKSINGARGVVARFNTVPR